MLRSKKEVDRHVRELLGKMKSDDDINRKLKGMNVARLYYNIKEYESARRYICEFLSLRSKSAEGHKLLGQIYEGLDQKENSLQSFKTSYEIADSQKNLLIKICELYQDVEADISIKLHWAEEAEKQFPHHEVVTTLRHSLLTNSTGQSRDELEKLYLDEIKANPLSVNLHLVLIKFYIEWGTEKPSKLVDAYNYALQVESKNVFEDCFDWYSKLEELVKTNIPIKKEEEFTEFHLRVLERLADLSITDAQNARFNPLCTPQDASETISKLDLLLGKLDKKTTSRPYVQHVICQLYFYLAKQLRNFVRDETTLDVDRMVGLLLSHAIRDAETSGLNATAQKWRNLRLSQSLHVLKGLLTGNEGEFFNKLKELSCIKSTRTSIYKLAMQCDFGNKEGFLMKDPLFEDPPYKAKAKTLLPSIDKEVTCSFHKDLATIIWILHQNDYPCGLKNEFTKEAVDLIINKTLLSGLPFSSVITMGTPESLCHLDIVAFLTGVVFCARSNHQQEYQDSTGQFLFLSSKLCTSEQSSWWDAAVALLENSSNRRLNRLRSVLQKGLEAVRLLGPYSPPMPVMAHIAQVFSLLVEELETSLTFPRNNLEALEERAEHYWTHVVHHAEQILKTRNNASTKVKLFDLTNCTMPKEKSEALVDQGRIFLAGRLVQKGKKAEAIIQYGQVNTPEASFNRGLLYKECADELIADNSPLSPSAQQEYKKQLVQARDSLYLTLDRLKAPGVSLKHPLNEDLHQQLSAIEDAIENSSVKKEDQGELDQSFNLASVSNCHLTMPGSAVASTPFHKGTPGRFRQEVRPSPERLDAQVRHLMELQQNSMKALEDQNSQMKAQNDTLMALMERIHLESKENVDFYRNLIQEKQNVSSPSSSLQVQITTLSDMMKDLQVDVRSIATEVSELRALKLSETDENKLEDREAKMAIDTANNQAHLGLYGNYPLNFYGRPGYPAVSPAMLAGMQRPMMATAGVLHSPKFLPATLKTETTLADHHSMTQMAHGPQMVSTVVSLPSSMPISQASEAISSSMPHSFSMSMPHPTVHYSPVQNDPPKSLVFSPEGFLSDIPAPLYSAVRPVGSPSSRDISLGLPGMRSQNEPTKTAAIPTTPTASAVLSPAAKPPQASPGTPVVATPKKNVSFNVSANDSQERVQEYEPNVDFQPVIDLPDLVEVKTGEEDEEKLFGHRAKLYRFDGETKEWKERGIGEIRLLKNKTDGKVRVLMRRDQTHKVCANHVITKDMKLTPLEKTNNVWAWAANDFADEEFKFEGLAARFKTPETGLEFKTQFEAAQKMILDVTPKPVQPAASVQPPKPKESKPLKSLSEMFKPAAGSWECDMCLVRNKPDAVACLSCQTPKPGCSPAPVETPTTTKPSTFSGFSFGVPASSSAVTVPSFSFSVPKTSAPVSTGNQSVVSSSTVPPTFSFGIKPTENTPKPTEIAAPAAPEPQKSFNFGIPASKPSAFSAPTTTQAPTFAPLASSAAPAKSVSFSFGVKTTAGSETKTSDIGSKPMFGDKPTLDFTSFAAPKSESAFTTSVPDAFKKPDAMFSQPKSEVSKDSSGTEEYEPAIDFKPVIDLPDLVEVKTGEEDEEVMFKSRCKLYRFDPELKEWKERGLGDLRILKNDSTSVARILMRREQTHKICANHVLSEDMKITAMDTAEKAWVWVANDFADEQLKIERLAARFKTQELADEFKTKFEEAIKNTVNKNSQVDVGSPSTPKTNTSDIKPQTPVAPETPKSMPSIFGGSPAGTDSVFSTPPNAGVKADAESPKPSIFGGSVSSGEASSTESPKQSIFGGSSQPKTETGTPSIFGGFSVSTTPGASQSTPEPAKSSIFGGSVTPSVKTDSGAQPSTQSIFGGISADSAKGGSVFGSGVSTPSKSIFDIKVDPNSSYGFLNKTQDLGSKPIFANGDTVGFGSLKSGSTSESIFKTKDVSAFKPQSLFSSSMSQNKTADSNNSKDATEDYEPNVDFKPVIDLPDLIEVKTGEEGQTVMFKERAKLYRFIPETKEWKERGIGNISILKDEASGKSRVLMRREQTHKLCANHFLTPDLKIAPMITAEKAWMWSASDYSEGELTHEKLAVRFKTQELADKFKKEFEDGQKSAPSVPENTSSPQKKEDTNAVEGEQKSLAQLFKPASGSWECAMCLVRNKETDTACLSCSTTKPGCTPQENPTKPSIFDGPTHSFKFGTNSTTPSGSVFDSAPVSSTSKPQSVFGSSTFTFGKTTFAPQTNGATPTFMFGGSPAPSVNGTVTGKTWTPPAFGGGNVQSPVSKNTSQCESEGVPEDDGSHIHFEPVVPLPDKIEVTTGEESQIPLYCHRAKLYRMVNKEWKERGLGDVKILKDPQSNKIRLLMRREQVHKICLNHFLQPNMVFKKLDAKAVSWGAEDFADMAEPTQEIFSLRFKTPEIAGGFVAALSEARVSIGGEPLDLDFPIDPNQLSVPSETNTTDDVKVTYKLSASQEHIEKARKLLLPDNFYLYEDAEPCAGCIGCDYEDEEETDTYDEDNSHVVAVECFFSVKEGISWHDYGKCTVEVDYDGDVFCNHISVHSHENFEIVADHLISVTTTYLQTEQQDTVTWTTDDDVAYGRRTFRARFDVAEELEIFKNSFNEGKMVAQDSEGGNFLDDEDYAPE